MHNFSKKFVVPVLLATTVLSNAIPVCAATTEGFSGLTAESSAALENSESLKNIPEEVFLYLYDLGGSVNIVENLSIEDKDAAGVYFRNGDTANRIEVSTKTIEAGFPNMLPYYLAHEVGHFIYFNADMTDDQKEVLNDLYNRLKPGDVDGSMTPEEVFADGYADYVTDGGFNMLQSEKDMFKAVEQNIVTKYLTAHPDYVAPVKEDEEPDFMTMPVWKLESYGPSVAIPYLEARGLL